MREGHYTLKPLSKKRVRDKRYLHSNNHKPIFLLSLNDCCVRQYCFFNAFSVLVFKLFASMAFASLTVLLPNLLPCVLIPAFHKCDLGNVDKKQFRPVAYY
jgi:hypothetical protein